MKHTFALCSSLVLSQGCRQKLFLDGDGDGYDLSEDCDDSTELISPAREEICNGVDDDCNGIIDDASEEAYIAFYADADGDGYGAGDAVMACQAPEGMVQQDGDCDDSNPEAYPYRNEVCNGWDDDCDGDIDTDAEDRIVIFPDADGDGYGSQQGGAYSCLLVPGWVENSDDCLDSDATINPAATEVCNGWDDDCDELVDLQDDSFDSSSLLTFYADTDGDGYGDSGSSYQACEPEAGWVATADDCNDSSLSQSPGYGYDSCDGVDNDCDGSTDEDYKSGWDLVSIDTNAGIVFDIDPQTALTTEISPISPSGVGINSMDVDESGLAYVHDYYDQQLWVIDACAGTMTLLGQHGVGNTCGIAFGPGGTLYGLDTGNDQLVQFDLQTGQATAIGPLGINVASCGLAYDCSNDRLIGADSTTDQIFDIDPLTGTASNFVQTGVPFQSVGLEFEPSTGQVLASDRFNLYRVDPVTGSTQTIGPLGGENIDDLAYHPACP